MWTLCLQVSEKQLYEFEKELKKYENMIGVMDEEVRLEQHTHPCVPGPLCLFVWVALRRRSCLSPPHVPCNMLHVPALGQT